MIGICRYCGGELYVEAPPFEEMTEKDKEDWKKSGGRIMKLCKDCGKEDLTEEQIRKSEREKTLEEVRGMAYDIDEGADKLCIILHKFKKLEKGKMTKKRVSLKEFLQNLVGEKEDKKMKIIVLKITEKVFNEWKYLTEKNIHTRVPHDIIEALSDGTDMLTLTIPRKLEKEKK